MDRLDRLGAELAHHGPARKAGAFDWLMGHKPEAPPCGLYLWGGVGRGKTMLMDLFFEGLAIPGKRRAHFHAYMAEVHGRIHAFRQKLKAGEVTGDDPIRPVAADLAAEAQVLCFDEFAVVDIADAMILGRLFTALFAQGVVVVATSNVPPDILYREGLNRALFLPFIELLQAKMETVKLEARTDFRLEKIGDARVYFTPVDAAATRAVDELFRNLTGGAPVQPARLTVLGHAVDVPAQAMGVARFAFADLCSRPLAASDYIALARAYHSVLIDDVPRLRPDQRNEIRRFITLIDVFYERHVKLIVSAATSPEEIFTAETGSETFEFARTVSRLHEMGSRDYLSAPRGRGQAVTGATTGLVET